MPGMREILSLQEVESLFRASREQPVWIFKHSLTCSISDAALSEFRRFVADDAAGEAAIHAIVLIQQARDVSDEIAERAVVRHESPQAILLRDGQAAWHLSHWQITRDGLLRAQRETAVGTGDAGSGSD